MEPISPSYSVFSYESGELDGTYILPPILYPDGNYYIKIGHHDKENRTILSFFNLRIDFLNVLVQKN